MQSRLQQSDQFHGKLNQLWAQLQLVRESSRIYDGQAGDQGWSTVSEKDMATISKVRVIQIQCDQAKEKKKKKRVWLGRDPLVARLVVLKPKKQ